LFHDNQAKKQGPWEGERSMTERISVGWGPPDQRKELNQFL